MDKVNGRLLEDYVDNDVRTERSGRLSIGEFKPTVDVTLDGMSGKQVEVLIDDSGYRLRTLLYYFINNDVVVKLVLNTIRDPNPATAEFEAIIESLKRQ